MRREGIEIPEIFHPVWIFPRSSRTLSRSLYLSVTGFFGRKGKLLSGSIREFWRNDTPARGELYLRIFIYVYLSWNFTSPYSRRKPSQRDYRFFFLCKDYRYRNGDRIFLKLRDIFTCPVFFFSFYTPNVETWTRKSYITKFALVFRLTRFSKHYNY